MSLNQAAFIKEDLPITASSVTPNPDDYDQCESCGRPHSLVCTECGEYAHDFKRGQKRTWVAVPLDHSDCQEGLGWREPADHHVCPVCDAIDSEAAWKDHKYGRGNW